MAEIIGVPTPEELGIKRFYLPGVIIKDKCPQCHDEVVRDLGEHYLSYPKHGEKGIFHMYCGECDFEWKIPVLLKISLELA